MTKVIFPIVLVLLSVSFVRGQLPSNSYEYGDIPWSDERAYLDNVALIMNAVPETTFFIRLNVPAGESIKTTRKHIKKMLAHIKRTNKYQGVATEFGRFDFAVVNKDTIRYTKISIFLKGAARQPCGTGCTLINGKSLK